MKSTSHQRGQSMVEYVVILMALTAALLYADYTTSSGDEIPQGYIGMSESEEGSLVQAINQKHRGHGYAMSLSEIPETDSWEELSDYYDSLGKYPELSSQLRSGGAALGDLNTGINSLANGIGSIKDYIPPKLPPDGFPPSFPPDLF